MIYGYASETINEYGLLAMREVTLAVEPATLRQLSAFLISMADMIESGQLTGHGHRHIDDLVKDWEGGCDIIVAPPEE